jgi:hypothetical protein
MYIISFLCSLYSYFWDSVVHVHLTLYVVCYSNGTVVSTDWIFEVIFLRKLFCYVHANTSSLSHGRLAFWDVTSCSLVEIYRHFGGSYCLHFQSRTVRSSSLSLYTFLVISCRNFLRYYFTLRNNDHILTENYTGGCFPLHYKLIKPVHITECIWRSSARHDVKRMRKAKMCFQLVVNHWG